MASYLEKLTVDLAEGAKTGIITIEQARLLHESAAARREASRIRGTTWIAIVAGFFIAAGVSLIIAHNWDKIPAIAKVAAFILVLCGVGETFLRTDPKSQAARIPLEILWFFLPLLGVGLYAQVFHLSGDPIRPYLIWLILSLPLAWLSPYPTSPTVHFIALIIILIRGNLLLDNMLALGSDAGACAPHGWLLTLLMLGLALAEGRYRLLDHHRVYAIGAFFLWLILILFIVTPLQTEHGGLRFLALVSAAILWLLSSVRFCNRIAELILPSLTLLGIVYAMTFLWHMDSSFSGSARPLGVVVVIALAVAAAFLTARMPLGTISPKRDWQRLAQGVLFTVIASACALAFDSVPVYKTVAVLANLLIAGAGAGLMCHGSLAGIRMQINAGAGLLVLVMITRFIDFLGSMAKSGAAFIVVGGLLVALAYGLHKSREALIRACVEQELP